MRLSWRSAVALVVGGILLGGTLSAVAQSDRGPREPVSQAHYRGGHGGPGGPGRFVGPRGHFGKLVTSQSVVEGEQEGTFDRHRTDAGTLQSVDGSTLVIERADGETVRVPTSDDTRIRRDGEEAEAGDLERGDRVVAHRTARGGDDAVTRFVMAISRERYEEMEQRREGGRRNSA